MSQPTNRTGNVAKPGKLDASLGEFWVENPWQIVARGHNLSAYERNRVYLNVRGQNFVDVSHLSGADSDGDGRSVVAADFRNVGMMDLLVRQAGGGALLLYENDLPRRSYLKVSLRAGEGNRLGVGARLTLKVRGEQQTRELFAANGFLSQAPIQAHFGLGEAKQVDELTVRWPSGKVQVFKDLTPNRHVLIDESKTGAQALSTWTPGTIQAP